MMDEKSSLLEIGSASSNYGFTHGGIEDCTPGLPQNIKSAAQLELEKALSDDYPVELKEKAVKLNYFVVDRPKSAAHGLVVAVYNIAKGAIAGSTLFIVAPYYGASDEMDLADDVSFQTFLFISLNVLIIHVFTLATVFSEYNAPMWSGNQRIFARFHPSWHPWLHQFSADGSPLGHESVIPGCI